MLRYTLNRVLLMIPTLIGVAVLVFFMLRVIPGDVVEVKLRGDGGNVSRKRSRWSASGSVSTSRWSISSRTGWSASRRSTSASRCGPTGR